MSGLDKYLSEIMKRNPWVSGMVDYVEGDPFAALETWEKYSSPVTIRESIEHLYEAIKLDGTIIFHRNNKVLVLMSHWNYGVFIYRYPETDYVEHVDQNISFQRFKEIIEGLTK